MSLLEILKLVGFATGAAIHIYVAWLIWKRRIGTERALTQPERTFIVIGLCLGAWFLGNLLTTLHVLLVGAGRMTAWLRAWDSITMIGVALVPSAILTAHLAVWSYLDDYRVLSVRKVRLVALAFYAPMLFLPYAFYRIAFLPYKPFFNQLGPLLVPYSVWYLFALSASAVISWAMKDKLAPEAARERKFFKQLAALLLVTGIFEFIVVGVRRSGPSDVLWVAYLLLSLLPAFFISYYIYRYKLVEVIIKSSVVYASLAVVMMVAYTFVVRRLDPFLSERYELKPGVIEALLILAMFALAGPLMRGLDRATHRLFTREIGLYRDVARQVTKGAAGLGEIELLIRYAEEAIRRGLDLTWVRIILFDEKLKDGPERRLAEKMIESETDVIDSSDDLASIGASAAYALKREGRLTGLMLIAASQRTLTSEKGDVLTVLASQVAIEIESCRLVEEKLRLERELTSRERLATLGQMATTIAHEVKNPLSAIKSIAQVMREEDSLREYDRDLELIVSEIDRLNRTVSQLLAFSRPSKADSRPVALGEMIASIIELFGKEAADLGVSLKVESRCDVTLDGAQSAALREAVGNLALNAIQATDRGGEVVIESRLANENAELILTVTDTGPGISEEAQAKVFEPFYTTKARGTGLGLAIVRRRALELGGEIKIESPVADGHGTRFTLRVPLALAAEV
jgi:signal transduction histidine kinase